MDADTIGIIYLSMASIPSRVVLCRVYTCHQMPRGGIIERHEAVRKDVERCFGML
jgi:hypothetical protein